MTNFQRTADINNLVGNETNGGWEAVDHQVKIVQSEWDELLEGIGERDIDELRDGIQDVLFTVYGLGHRAGMPVDLDYDELVRSQMSKFDTTEESALLTRKKYEAMGMSVIQKDRVFEGRVYVVTYSAKDQYDHQNRFAPEGKWLKSRAFEEPRYQPLPNDVQLALDV